MPLHSKFAECSDAQKLLFRFFIKELNLQICSIASKRQLDTFPRHYFLPRFIFEE
jgi:hypothetical protein